MRRLLLMPVALALAATTSVAQIYKWVDEKGVTHYSETPPPDKKTTKVETGPASAPATPSTSPSWKQKEIDSRRTDIERRQSDDAGQKKSAYDDAVRKDRCVRAQRDLRIYETQLPVYNRNDRGEKVYVEDSARPAKIQEARRNVEGFCK